MSMPASDVFAELLALARQVGDLAGVQQRLGGDAAAVQARAADLVLLDENDVQAELGRAERGGVSTGATTEDDEIGGGGGCAHGCSSLQSSASRSSGRGLALILPLRERAGPERRCFTERRNDHWRGTGRR